jgi:hypothetical protein
VGLGLPGTKIDNFLGDFGEVDQGGYFAHGSLPNLASSSRRKTVASWQEHPGYTMACGVELTMPAKQALHF